MDTCTITHDMTGIRLHFGDGTVHHYDNQAALAVALAHTMREANSHYLRAKELDNLRVRALKASEKSDATVQEIGAILDNEIPF